jgi:hypothetical protein
MVRPSVSHRGLQMVEGKLERQKTKVPSSNFLFWELCLCHGIDAPRRCILHWKSVWQFNAQTSHLLWYYTMSFSFTCQRYAPELNTTKQPLRPQKGNNFQNSQTPAQNPRVFIYPKKSTQQCRLQVKKAMQVRKKNMLSNNGYKTTGPKLRPTALLHSRAWLL